MFYHLPSIQINDKEPEQQNEKKYELTIKFYLSYVLGDSWKPEIREQTAFAIINNIGYIFGGIGKEVFGNFS